MNSDSDDRAGRGDPSNAEYDAIEFQLRAIDEPEVPPDLLSRLLANIPREATSASISMQPRSTFFRRTVVAAVAAIILLVVTIAWTLRDQPPDPLLVSEPSSDSLTAETITLVSDETNPCHILPPLPEWQ